MNLEFIHESLTPPEYQPMFSPAWWPRPHVRSTLGPLVWDRYPCAAMRRAFATATLYRHPLHDSGPRPWLDRSALISACCVDPMTMAARAGAAGGAGGGVGGGVGITGRRSRATRR